MADIRNSGYHAAETTVLSTELNSLASETWAALSSEQDVTANGYLFMDIEVVTGNPSTGWTAGGNSELYVVPTLDGTNYPTFVVSGTNDEPENNPYFVGSTPNQGSGTTGYRSVKRGVEVPAGKFKVGFRNKNGDALASSGNTVKIRYWSYTNA